MFHVKQRRLLGLFLTVGLVGSLAVGCSRTSSRGWSAPIEDTGTQIVSVHKGKLDGVEIGDSAKPAWTGKLSQDLDSTSTKLSTSTLSTSGTAFQGDLIQIDDEVMRVRSLRVNDAGRELTLERGFAGTIAAEHSSGATVSAFRRPWRYPDDWRIPDKAARSFGGFYGQPVVASDGVVYVGDYNGRVYAFRPGDARLDAAAEDEQPVSVAVELDKPIIGGGALDAATNTLYFAADTFIYKVSAADLKQKLGDQGHPVAHSVIRQTQDDVWGTLVLANGKLLVASLDGSLYAIDTATGADAWVYTADKGFATTPVVTGGRVLVAGFGDTLYAVDLNTGNLDWSFQVANWIWSTPTVDDGIAYFGDFDGILHAVNVNDGTEEWSLNLGHGTLRASPAIVDDHLVVGSDDGWVMGVDLRSREKVWEKDIDSGLLADMVASGDEVLMAPEGCSQIDDATTKTYFRAVDPENGDLKQAEGVC
jgi:outer membrane protein assembly factor BamB